MSSLGISSGIIADDLTGASDTALQFFLAGYPATILPDWMQQSAALNAEEEGTSIWAINTASRHMEPTQAVARVRQAAQTLRDRFGVENFYKKIDSTLRGSIASECLSALEALGNQCAIIAPAYPEEGRQTVGGYQLVRGVPLERTHVNRDPLFPVWQSHVPTLLAQQCGNPDWVDHVSLSTVMHGAGPLFARLQQALAHGKKLVVVDACALQDLDQIALALEKLQKSLSKKGEPGVLPVGSAGLARAIARHWFSQKKQPQSCDRPSFNAAALLVINGSDSDITRSQWHYLRDAEAAAVGQQPVATMAMGQLQRVGRLAFLPLSPAQLLGAALPEELLDQLKTAMQNGHPVLINASHSEDTLPQTLKMGEEQGLSGAQISAQVQHVLGELAQQLLAQQPAHLIACGGETSAMLCATLNLHTLRLKAAIEPSIPVLQDAHTGQVLVTKSGGFGSPHAMGRILNFLRTHSPETHSEA